MCTKAGDLQYAGTGMRRWSEDTVRWRRYRRAESGLWSTAHAAQGRTVTAGIPLVTGTEDAQWLYSALTRGAETNIAVVFTHQPAADPSPGTRPAPELARQQQVAAERTAETTQLQQHDTTIEPRPTGAVLADILSRDGRQLSHA